MDEDMRKEQFSNAYLRAIAAAAGYNVYKPEVDDDSVDWGIGARGGGGTVRSPRVELQLKCTSSDVQREDHLAYPLKLKNYEDLRLEDYLVSRILVVVLVPELISDWLTQTEDAIALRRCGYWVSLRGQPATANTGKVTVHMPRTQILSVDQLSAMMHRLAHGGLP